MEAAISFPLLGDIPWNVPRAIPIPGFPVYLYGLFIAIGYGLAAYYAYRRRKDFDLSGDNVMDLLLIAVVAGIVGARLYYVAFSINDYVGAGKWLNIFKLREGGLAVYGGIILVGIVLVIYARLKKIKLLKMLDVAAIAVPIGQAIGRWGNFVNREAYGGETTLPWRMGLHFDSGTIYVHPAFLYESLWNAAGFLLLHTFSKRRKRGYDGQMLLLYAAWYGLGRMIIEGIRTDNLMFHGFRVSQVFAAACLAVSCALMIIIHFKRKTLAIPVETSESDAT